MKRKLRQSRGFTLTELIVTISIVAMLIFAAKPAMRACRKSFASAGTKSMISSALASARALAAKEQRYAGVRFQKAYHTRGPLGAPQYMTFVVQDPNLKGPSGHPDVFGFRTVAGLKPIKLPNTLTVMDLRLGQKNNERIDDYDEINDDVELNDTTTFSIVFSPTGKLVVHKIQVLKRNVDDPVFNISSKVVNGQAMFEEDSQTDAPYQEELSRGSFIIYDKNKFSKIDADNRWTDYLEYLYEHEMFYINPYTGTIIEK